MKNITNTLLFILLTTRLAAQTTLSPEMVFVEGGTFTMGCTPEQQPCNINYGPTRLVRLKSFWIGKYEVTQAEFVQVMGFNPSNFVNCGMDCPVESICFFDCLTFCNKYSLLQGLEPCYFSDETYSNVFDSLGGGGTPLAFVGGYPSLEHVYYKESANGYRLPSESEWEYAARGGTNEFQTKYSGSDNADLVAWSINNNSPNGTKPVGQNLPNSLGAFDMTGNVNEYVFDFDANQYGQIPSSYIIESCHFIFNPQFGYAAVNGFWGWTFRGGDYNDTANQVSWRSGGLCSNSLTMAGKGTCLARNAD